MSVWYWEISMHGKYREFFVVQLLGLYNWSQDVLKLLNIFTSFYIHKIVYISVINEVEEYFSVVYSILASKANGTVKLWFKIKPNNNAGHIQTTIFWFYNP